MSQFCHTRQATRSVNDDYGNTSVYFTVAIKFWREKVLYWTYAVCKRLQEAVVTARKRFL